jgi:uncharacterized protein (TIGR03086 family)
VSVRICYQGVNVSRILRNYTQALYGFDAVVQRVDPESWSADTQCDGWSAGDLVCHLVGVLDAIAQMASTGEIARPQTPNVGDNVVELWGEGRDNLLAALDQPGVLHKEGPFWFGTSSIEDLLSFAQWDPLIHAWDLGQAVGLDPHSNQQLAENSIGTIAPMAETLLSNQIIGEPVAVPDNADSMTRLLGLTGRNPFG